MSEPFPKSVQLARGERRHVRRKASPGQWQRIIAAKTAPCRVCIEFGHALNGGFRYEPQPLELHHIVPRDLGGDDVADNILALCRVHHAAVTQLDQRSRAALHASLTDAERAYCEAKMGAEWSGRLFGVGGSEG